MLPVTLQQYRNNVTGKQHGCTIEVGPACPARNPQYSRILYIMQLARHEYALKLLLGALTTVRCS